MNPPTLLVESCVAIIGLGLMGGSLAKALRDKCSLLIGVDSDPNTLTLALEHGVVDLATDDPAELLPRANLIILAIPVRAILSFLKDLPKFQPHPAVVLDIGSTKVAILEAMSQLPNRFDPVGGHPMCGSEKSGLTYADPLIYKNAPFALCPLSSSSPRARTLIEEIVRTIGARPIWLDAETHDRWVAATSHLPYLVSSALASSTPLETAPLIGPGYRSTTRLAVSPVEMMVDILSTNRNHIVEALRRFHTRLSLIESCLESGNEGLLQDLLAQAAHHQGEILQPPPEGTQP